MSNEPRSTYFAKKYWPHWLVGLGVVVLVVAGSIGWSQSRSQPEDVFWGMLEQSMRTSGVTLEATQDALDSNVRHWQQYSLGGVNQAHSLTTIEQSGSKVTTEVIGTTDRDYTRYADIETDQKGKDGKPIDVSDLEGVWAQSIEGDSKLLAQTALGLSSPFGALPVPIANLNPEARAEMLELIWNDGVYQIDYSKVETLRENGRKQYVYPVEIQVILYANLMKQFAKKAGLSELDNLDPNSYSGSPPMELKLTVDVRSRHLVSVEFAESSEGKPYVQTYSAYDVPANVDIPERAISTIELQNRLQGLQ